MSIHMAKGVASHVYMAKGVASHVYSISHGKMQNEVNMGCDGVMWPIFRILRSSLYLGNR